MLEGTLCEAYLIDRIVLCKELVYSAVISETYCSADSRGAIVNTRKICLRQNKVFDEGLKVNDQSFGLVSPLRSEKFAFNSTAEMKPLFHLVPSSLSRVKLCLIFDIYDKKRSKFPCFQSYRTEFFWVLFDVVSRVLRTGKNCTFSKQFSVVITTQTRTDKQN